MKRFFVLLSAVALNAAAASTPATPPAPAKAELAPAATTAKTDAPKPLPPDAPLVSDGKVKVDIEDLDAYMLRIPEKMRVPVRTSYDRVASIVDALFVTRSAAEKAREAGLDKDPAVQRRMQQVQEAFLADLYMQKIQAEVDKVDLTQRAKELYLAEPEKFKTQEAVYVQDIIVGLNGRTHDMALARANDVLAQAKAGKDDFLQLAAKYSDDPDKVRNGGDLGFFAPSHFPDAVQKAIAKLSTKGEIAGPIETKDGFYIVRFVDRHPPRLASFEEVKDGIISDERERLRKERMDQFLEEVRGSKTVVINQKNVESYVVPVDVKSLEKQEAKKLREEAKK